MKSGATVMALLLTASCSWAVVDKPPPRDPGYRPLRCTETSLSAWLDAVVGAPWLLAGLALVGTAAVGEDRHLEGPGGTAMLIVATPFVLSAYYGFKHTGRCKRWNRREPRPGWSWDEDWNPP